MRPDGVPIISAARGTSFGACHELESTLAETVRRFRNEAQSAARLDHEHITRVYFVGEDQGWHYIVFEFIEGVNLRDFVARGGDLAHLGDAADLGHARLCHVDRALAEHVGEIVQSGCVLAGSNPASETYVRSKAKQTVEAGMRSFDHRLPETVSQDELLALVRKLVGEQELLRETRRDEEEGSGRRVRVEPRCPAPISAALSSGNRRRAPRGQTQAQPE